MADTRKAGVAMERVQTEGEVHDPGDLYREARVTVNRLDQAALVRRSRSLLHRRAIYGISAVEHAQLAAVVDEYRRRYGTVPA